MKQRKIILLSILSYFLLFNNLYSQEVLQWRGADRTGKYNETGLLKKWIETGPVLLWENNLIGNGYGSPIMTNSNIYVNGEIDSICYLFALDLKGKLLWKSKIGPEWTINYPGARTTPTLVGGLLYVETGMGNVACFESATGKEKWRIDMVKDLNGRNTRFGFSESPLIEGDKVFCTPGGKDTNVVALDRFTGKIIWICNGLGQMPSYCSPLLISLKNRSILLTFSQNAMLCIDTKDGKLLWSHKQDGEGDVHVNTPVFENGFIYYITGSGNGAVKLKLSEDGSEITEIWRNLKSDNF
jgi:outer membrane protein assembly factor BamB